MKLSAEMAVARRASHRHPVGNIQLKLAADGQVADTLLGKQAVPPHKPQSSAVASAGTRTAILAHRHVFPLAVAAVGWIVVALLLASSRFLVGPTVEHVSMLAHYGAYVWWGVSWIAVTAIALVVARHVPLGEGRLFRQIVIHLAIGAVVIVARYWLTSQVDLWIGLRSQTPAFRFFLLNLPWDIIYYVLLVGIGYAIEFQHRGRVADALAGKRELSAARLRTRVAEAKVQSLRMRLDPELLSATLRAIASNTANPRRAHFLIARLGDLLRAAIGVKARSTMEDEAELLEKYLELEALRSGAKVALNIAPAVRDAHREAPSLFLVHYARELIGRVEAKPSSELLLTLDPAADAAGFELRLLRDGELVDHLTFAVPQAPTPDEDDDVEPSASGPHADVIAAQLSSSRPAPPWVWPVAFLAFWGVIGLLGSTPYLALERPDGGRVIWWEVARVTLLDAGSWAAVAMIAFYLTRTLPRSAADRVRHLIIHLAAGTLIILIRFVVANGAGVVLGWFPAIRFDALPSLLLPNYILYFLMVGAGYSISQHRAYRERKQKVATLALEEAALHQSFAEAHLSNLKAQLHPHFLFNALNAISGELERNPDDAAQMVEHLHTLLDAAVARRDQHEATLAEELELLHAYLAIEGVRFGDRLNVSIDVDSVAADALVPDFLLQPLAENAVKHGMRTNSAQHTIRVECRQEAGELRIHLRDSGTGATGKASASGFGVGLSNLRIRLRRLYGAAADLTLRPTATGTTVEVTLPFRRKGDGESVRGVDPAGTPA